MTGDDERRESIWFGTPGFKHSDGPDIYSEVVRIDYWLVYAEVKVQRENGKEGNILMDVPPPTTSIHLQLYWY